MKIEIVVGKTSLTAELDDNPSSRDFYRRLPLTIKLEDYANTEKIAYLDAKLTTEQAPKGANGNKGDITYYAPWGNLAIFYRDFGYANGLIHLGKIKQSLEPLLQEKSPMVEIKQSH